MENFVQSAQNWISVYWIKVVGALLILIIGRIVTGIIGSMIKKIMVKSKTDETLIGFFSSLIKVALMTFVIIAALGNLGVQTTSFVAIIGAAGIAVGFALQGSLANFASGVMIIIFRPFKAGDFVEAGGTTGSIEKIGIFSTFMKTPDNKEIIMPNSKITGETITNFSAKETRRVDMVFGISYDDNIKLAKDTLWEIINADERILKDPAPAVAVSELGESSVNLVVRPWVKTEDYWNVLFDTTEKVKLVFDEKGISIPYPQTDVHLHQVSKQ
ncbi:MAG: mechanosensitive ion channel domain-containing protein [Candidatus Zixiibacteriota bacterium]